MYKKIIFKSILLILSLNIFAQDDYFQQEVHYDIDVVLDHSIHYLNGNVDIEYVNNSPDELNEIYLHLWPNAYRNRQTAFSKQILENGNSEFYFAKPNQLGGYKEINIKVNEKVVEWDYWNNQPDISLIVLDSPLKSGEKLTINTQFRMKIPESFSRLGHVGQSYQMTQWYPKPAVYDKNGWHPMPYLDQGEFYSEFGSFDVKITLPKEYIVGATGVLQTEEEIAFLNKKIEETQTKIKNKEDFIKEGNNDSVGYKTIHYIADNVHDFAWFADRDFYVNKSEVTLSDGKIVDTYVMFTDYQADLWVDAIDYVNRSVQFYSERIGNYPYPHATAVQSALSAGAGMEYPMITVIGSAGNAQALDEVITHEVGHNWFYGILASNERDYAWMDEGFNSYYEHEYMEKYYEEQDSYLDYQNLSGVSAREADQLTFYLPMRRHTDQAINTPSQDLRQFNYWMGAYDKPAMLLKYLEEYLGSDTFNKIMKTYYETWQFKHPQPSDVKALFEKESGKNLDWFFNDLINTTEHIDYKIKKILYQNNNYSLTIENVGDVSSPFPIDIIEEGKIVNSIWVEGFEGEKTIDLNTNIGDKFVIDYKKNIPDYNRKNNTITRKGGKIEPIQLKFLGGVENPDRTSIYWTPAVAMNTYDGFMGGLALYNTVLPSKRFEWSLVGMYGTRSKDFNGLANLRYNIYPEKLQRVSLGVGYKGFSYSENDFYEQFGASKDFDYHRTRPYVELELKKKRARSNTKQTITAQVLIIQQQLTGSLTRETTPTDTFFVYSGHEFENMLIPQIKYEISNRSVLQPYSVKVGLETQSYKTRPTDENAAYLKMDLEANYSFMYMPNKGIHIRGYLGAFLFNTQKDAGGTSNVGFARGSFSLIGQGAGDYTFDQFYFGRSHTDQIWSQQVHTNQGGGFKTPIGGLTSLGESNNFIAAANIKFDIPIPTPAFIPAVRPYLDLGYFSNTQPSAENQGEMLIAGGVALEFLDGRIGLYLPMFHSENLKLYMAQRGNYFARISFQFDLNKLNPFSTLYNFDL